MERRGEGGRGKRGQLVGGMQAPNFRICVPRREKERLFKLSEELFPELNLAKAPPLGLAHPQGERHRQGLCLLLLAMGLGLRPTAMFPWTP